MILDGVFLIWMVCLVLWTLDSKFYILEDISLLSWVFGDSDDVMGLVICAASSCVGAKEKK